MKRSQAGTNKHNIHKHASVYKDTKKQEKRQQDGLSCLKSFLKSHFYHRRDSAKSSSNCHCTLSTVSRGGLMAGVLSDQDLNSQYGSSASTQFSPFVVAPDPHVDPTTRWLKKR